MNETNTTEVVQNYLDSLGELEGDSAVEPAIRALLGRAVGRIQLLCRAYLNQSYRRLTRPPLNLQTDEVLSAVVERLLKALRETRPKTVRQFFGLANQHIRWELNDLARCSDKQMKQSGLPAELVPVPESSDSSLSLNARHILEAIENLPEDEREAFSIGMSQAEAADLLGVSAKTVQRRLHRSLVLLTEKLSFLQ